jgi:hypothetical protein
MPPSSLLCRCADQTLRSGNLLCAHLYTDILCLLADPLDFEDPPLGIPVAARTRRWMDS